MKRKICFHIDACFWLLMLSLIPINAIFAKQPTETEQPTDAEQKFAERLDEWKTVFINGDVDAMMKLYVAGDETLVILSRGMAVKGEKRIREMFETGFAEAKFENISVDNLQITINENTATCYGHYKFEMTINDDGSKWLLQIQTSFVFVKQNESWKIQLEHSSPIGGVQRLTPRD